MTAEQTRQMVSNIVDQEAVMLAVNHTFIITAAVLLLAAGVVWLSPRVRLPAGGPPGGGH
jgi:DHA2 family multidrug resistance protein